MLRSLVLHLFYLTAGSSECAGSSCLKSGKLSFVKTGDRAGQVRRGWYSQGFCRINILARRVSGETGPHQAVKPGVASSQGHGRLKAYDYSC